LSDWRTNHFRGRKLQGRPGAADTQISTCRYREPQTRPNAVLVEIPQDGIVGVGMEEVSVVVITVSDHCPAVAELVTATASA